MFIPWLIAMILYVAGVFVSYSSGLKETIWFYPVGLGLAICTNLIWLYLIKDISSKPEIMTKAFTWDAMRLIIYAVTPVLALNAQIDMNKVIAVILIFLGMVMLNAHIF
jgi:uncharacterized membrane protein